MAKGSREVKMGGDVYSPEQIAETFGNPEPLELKQQLQTLTLELSEVQAAIGVEGDSDIKQSLHERASDLRGRLAKLDRALKIECRTFTDIARGRTMS